MGTLIQLAVRPLPVGYLQRPAFAPFRVTGSDLRAARAIMDEEPPPASIVPSPDPLTESDDEQRPQSAQIADPSNAANVDSEGPVFSAVAALVAASDMDPPPDEADEATDSSLESTDKRRKRNCRPGVKKPRILFNGIILKFSIAMP